MIEMGLMWKSLMLGTKFANFTCVVPRLCARLRLALVENHGIIQGAGGPRGNEERGRLR